MYIIKSNLIKYGVINMIQIIYDSDKDHIFDLRYDLYKYIPKPIFEKYSESSELHFIRELFTVDPYIHFIREYPMVWSRHYVYRYIDKIFTMALDEDYNLINYVVENIKDRKEVAEYICKLIENQKKVID